MHPRLERTFNKNKTKHQEYYFIHMNFCFNNDQQDIIDQND